MWRTQRDSQATTAPTSTGCCSDMGLTPLRSGLRHDGPPDHHRLRRRHNGSCRPRGACVTDQVTLNRSARLSSSRRRPESSCANGHQMPIPAPSKVLRRIKKSIRFAFWLLRQMKSIKTQAIRRANLKRLVDCIGSQTELARILDMSPSYINTMLRGRRTITGKAARKMEKRLSLELCWLDDYSDG